MESEATFSYTDGFVEFGAGVVIPTFDIYSDVSLIALLLNIDPKTKGEYSWLAITFGKMMIIPLILSTLFIIPHWLECEKAWKSRLLTFPLVLLQLYPQYRSMRVLWWAFFRKNLSQCLKEKHYNDYSISYVEVFAEAVIQMHLCFLLNGFIDSMDAGFWINPLGLLHPLGWLGDNIWLVWLSFSISFSSATFGMSKFLKIGPVKIVNHPPDIGHVPLVGFGIIMIIILSFMMSKALWVFLNTVDEDFYGGHRLAPVGLGDTSAICRVFLFWLLFSMTPQFLMALTIFFCQLGLKKTLSMLSTSPGLLLISVFTPFTVSCKTLNEQKYIFISKKWTVINFALSIVFYLCGSCFLDLYYLPSSPKASDYTFYEKNWYKDFGIPSLLFNLKICLPLFLFSILLYALLLNCKIRGQSLYKRTAMNIDDPNDIIDLDNLEDGGDLEMGVLKSKKALIADPSTLPCSPRIVCIPKPFEV